MNHSDFLDRTELLLGAEALARLRRSRVLVLGLGGVGSWCAEFLIRAGIGSLMVVDGDRVESSNRNRQLPALMSTLGRPKAEVLAARLRDINPEARIEPVVRFFDETTAAELLTPDFDYVVDAIDSLSAKAYFLAHALRLGVPLVSSMGSGGRLDPAAIRIGKLAETHGCRLARAVRKRLQRLGVSGTELEVVYSPEPVPEAAVRPPSGEGGRSTVGTISYLPALFGGFLASVVIRRLSGVGLPDRNRYKSPEL